MGAAAATAAADQAATQAQGEQAEGPADAVVDVDRRRGDRGVLPVPVLLAGQPVAEDGRRPVLVVPDPAEPDAGQLQVDLPERRLRPGAREQRDHLGRDDSRWRSRRLVLRLRPGAPALQGQVPDPRRWSCRSRRSPAIAIAAPLFRLWSDIGLFNTLIGLIIPNLTFALPLAIYILVSFFKEIPKDLEEAALVDGATHFQAFRKIVVPLAAPGLATAAHPRRSSPPGTSSCWRSR